MSLSPRMPPPPPPPLPSPPLPSARATNGFLALCTTYALFALFLLWALLPAETTAHPSLNWLPDQAWTTIGPCFLMVTVLVTYGSYLGLMIYHTPPLHSLALLVDQRSEVPPRPPHAAPSEPTTPRPPTARKPVDWKSSIGDGPYDVPIGMINRVIFPPRRRRA